jgi:hypothetical protein
MSDIKLNKDYKHIHGVPSKYVSITPEGLVLPAPDALQALANEDNTVANRDGIRVYRLGGDEENNRSGAENRDVIGNEGVAMVEKAYLPKNVNMNYLMHEADRRTPDEDKRLNDADLSLLGIDRKIEYVPEDVLDLPDVPGMENSRGSRVSGASAGDGDDERTGQVEDGDELAAGRNIKLIRDINKAATELSKKLSKSTPWYINRFTNTIGVTNTNRSFDDLKDDLDQLKKLSGDALKNGGRNATGENVTRMLELLKSSIDNSIEYLQDKSIEFKADGTRKNSKSKSGTEQSRIRAAVDSYESLSRLYTNINAAVKKQSKAYSDLEHKKASDNVKDYKDLLIATRSKDMNKLQDETFRNKTDIPERHMRRLVRLEAVFGKKPEFLEEYQDPNRMKPIEVREGDKVTKVSPFTQLTEIKDEFKAIGPASKNAKLSDKDFAAIAVAESYSKEIFLPEYEKLKKEKAMEGVSFDTIYKNYAYHTSGCFSAELIDKLGQAVPFAEKARQKAVKDLKAYENGDKKPLATAIATSLNMLTDKWRSNMTELLDTGGEYLINSEMGQRMYGMLERDPELMQLAREAGLKPETQFNLKAMEKHGRNVMEGIDYINAGLKDKIIAEDKLWEDKDIKDDRFAEIILHEALRQEDFKSDARKENNVKEIREYIQNTDAEYFERLEYANAKEVQAMIRAFGDRDDFKHITDRFNKAYKEKGLSSKDTIDNSEALVGILNDLRTDVISYKSMKLDSLDSLEREHVAYYQDEIDALKNRRRLQGEKVAMSYFDEKIYATDRTKEFLAECEKKRKDGVKLTPAEQQKYTYLKDLTDRYATLSGDARSIGEISSKKQQDSSYIKFRQLVVSNALKMKYDDQNTIAERFNMVGQKEDLKERFKVFMKYKGYDKWSLKELAGKINTHSKEISSNLLGEMLQFEKDLNAGKIKLNEQPLLHR